MYFCAVNVKKWRLRLVFTWFQCGFDFGRSKWANYWSYVLRRIFGRNFVHTLEQLEAARPEKNSDLFFSTTETPDYYWHIWRPVIGWGTLSALAVLNKKIWIEICRPLSPFMAVSMIPYTWHSSCDCVRHSWLTKSGAMCLNHLVTSIITGHSPCPRSRKITARLNDKYKK